MQQIDFAEIVGDKEIYKQYFSGIKSKKIDWKSVAINTLAVVAVITTFAIVYFHYFIAPNI